VTDSDVSRKEREELKEVATIDDHIGPRHADRQAPSLLGRVRHVWSSMRWMVIVLALTVAQACDPPWAGPTLPDGSGPLNLTLLSVQGPIGIGPNIMASTSLASLRAKVISTADRTQPQLCQAYLNDPDPCWTQQVDRQGRLYIAVITNPECTNPTKEVAATSGYTVYFIHWAGNAQRTCSAAMALPHWRLYSASRGDLPSSGTLTVRLQLQGTERGGAESQVELS